MESNAKNLSSDLQDGLVREYCRKAETLIAVAASQTEAIRIKEEQCQKFQQNAKAHSLRTPSQRISIRSLHSSMERIEPTTPIEALVEEAPGVVSYLIDRGLPCIVCGEPLWGTLGEMAREKGRTEGEIEELVATINSLFIARRNR